MTTPTYTFTAVVTQQGDEFYAFCPEQCTDAVGSTEQEALANLRAATLKELEEDKALAGYTKPTLTHTEFTVEMADGPSRTSRYEVIVHQEHGLYVAFCPEVGVASQGRTLDEVMMTLKQTAELLLNDMEQIDGKPKLVEFTVQSDAVKGVQPIAKLRGSEMMPGVLMTLLRKIRMPLDEFLDRVQRVTGKDPRLPPL